MKISAPLHERPDVRWAGGRLVRFCLALAASACLVAPLAVRAGDKRVEFAQIRIADNQEEAVIELPVRVLEALQGRAPSDIVLAQVKGTALRVPTANLLQAVMDKKAGRDEVLFTSVQEPNNVPLNCYVRRVEKKVPEPTAKPGSLIYTTRRKQGSVSTRIKVALDAVEQFAGNFAAGAKDPDFSPLIHACLMAARDLDQGPLLHIVSSDEEMGFTLE